MAKQSSNYIDQYNNILKNINKGIFAPIYVLMGDEPYFNDKLLEAIIEKGLQPDERDFNLLVTYGLDTNTADIVANCKRFPMFAPRQIVVVKEAQHLTKLDKLESYLDSVSNETILVLLFSNSRIDKRTTIFKKLKTVAEVFETTPYPETKLPQWIIDRTNALGAKIEQDAALLLAENVGSGLRKVDLEIDKLIKLAAGKPINVSHIEEAIGISREFSAFELCRAISLRDISKSYKIAYHLGENSKKYPLVLTLGAMFYYFSKLLKIHAVYIEDKSTIESAIRKCGINFYTQINEYSKAVLNFKLIKTVQIISLIKEYDYKCKSGTAGQAADGELLLELVSKILN